jgi:hypothetical protein
MVFPLHQTGSVRVQRHQRPAEATALRIAEALRSQTVEDVEVSGHHVRFTCTMDARIPRPGGDLWLFSMFDKGVITVEAGESLTLRYRLSTTAALRSISTLSLILALPAIIWPWPWLVFSIMSFVGLFGGNYLEKRIRFPLWLRKVATSETLPQPRPPKVASSGG